MYIYVSLSFSFFLVIVIIIIIDCKRDRTWISFFFLSVYVCV